MQDFLCEIHTVSTIRVGKCVWDFFMRCANNDVLTAYTEVNFMSIIHNHQICYKIKKRSNIEQNK